MGINDKKSSIATKMVIFIIFFTVLVASIASAIILIQDYEKEMKSVEEKMVVIKKSLMTPLAQALYTEDEEQIPKALKGILNIEGITEIRVRLEDEEKDSYNLINDKLKKMTVKDRRALGPDKKIKIIYLEEEGEEGEEGAEGEFLGDLYVYSTLELAKQKIRNQMIKFGIVQLSQVFVLAIAIFLIFRSLIARHLKSMATYAQNLDLDDLSGPDLSLQRKKSQNNDELQDLTDSFNNMKGNLKSAHAKLKDYADNLESIVDERTQELNQEKNNVTKLLHNMSQAVFKVNEDEIIIGPVSEFTKDVFGADILGKSIMEVLYKDIDPKSILFSEINSVFNVSFGEDEIQWYAVGHTLPEVLGVKIGEDKRILHSVHDPIYNDDEELEFILYVVEDITEKVRQEEELSKKDEQLKIMKEALDFGSRKDLTKVMNKNFSLTIDSMNSLEKMWKLKKENEYQPIIIDIFRNLHTIKGSSRTLKVVRDIVHNVEDDVEKVMKKKKNFNHNFLSKLDRDLHKIHGTLFKYVRVINEQLRMGINVDSEILEGIKDKHKHLEKFEEREGWLNYINFLEHEFVNFSKLCLAVNENEVFNKIDTMLSKIKENKIAGVLEKPDVKVSIKNSTLEIKTELNSILHNIKNYSEKLSTSMEDGIPIENVDWVKKEIWNLQEKGDFNKNNFEDVFKKINNESLFGLMKSFDKSIKEMSTDLGKKVSLKIKGDDFLIESKKAQELKGVLVHIVRNSVDHGIELPDERKKKGKNESGQLIMTCAKSKDNSSTLKINIEDDGNGIDAKKLYERAIKEGIIDDKEMKESEKINLIFLPSLSTKEEVTDVSGRGIGMDAVKDMINKMGGEIKVHSTISKGTKFEISIPE
ncbi:ATP-binding protein [Bacteriovoracales bacterium]|nr:ATP-binding protein [Bacteriovoracales bacterium]